MCSTAACIVLSMLGLAGFSYGYKVCSGREVKPGSFADSLFTKYSTGVLNGSMDLNRLLNGLQISGKATAGSCGTGLGDKCFSASPLLSVFGVNSTHLDRATFARVCPAILQQVDNKACQKGQLERDGDQTSKEPKNKAWGYGFLAVTVVNVAPLLGLTAVPFMNVQVYKTVLLFMVSLAVGVLCGSSVFHLIPMAFGLSSHTDGGDDSHKSEDPAYLFHSAVIAGGVYLFFVMEYFLRMYARYGADGDGGEYAPAASSHGHSHHIQPLLRRTKDSKQKETVADVQLEFYNVMEDHHMAHNNSICINNEMNTKLAKDPAAPDETGKEPAVSVVISELDATRMSQSKENLTDAPVKRKVKAIAWTIVIGDCVHNFIDGIAMGAAFSSSIIEGFSTALAILGEEVPHELGDFAVLLSAGMEYRTAVLFNLLSGVICYGGLVLGLLLGYATTSVKWVYAIAAGMFLYISLVDMLPEANEMSCKEGQDSVKSNLKKFALQNCGMLVGYGIMFLLALYSHDIQF